MRPRSTGPSAIAVSRRPDAMVRARYRLAYRGRYGRDEARPLPGALWPPDSGAARSGADPVLQRWKTTTKSFRGLPDRDPIQSLRAPAPPPIYPSRLEPPKGIFV